MAELKTRPTDASVADHIASFDDECLRDDARIICTIMKSMSGKPARMWGPSIIGFDSYTYGYASGQEFEMARFAFAIRKKNLTIYLSPGYKDQKVLKKLGKFKLSGSCLHIKTLSDIHIPTLKVLLKESQSFLNKFLAERKKKLKSKK